MLHVLPDGERRYRLIDDAGREVGWIRGRAVRFFGFVSEQEVMTAARKAWRALQTVLARAVAHAADRALPRQLRLVHDGAYEWISDGTIPIARLYRPRPFDGTSFSIELVVPVYADEEVAVSAAHAIAEALNHPGESLSRKDALATQGAGEAVPLDAA